MFSQEDWANHKSTARYWRHIATMPRRVRPRASACVPQHACASPDAACLRRSRTVQSLLAPTTFCFLQTAAVAAYATAHPAGWPELPRLGQEFFNLTGGALSLLLVFRTDASYNRWDEARQQWGEFIFHGRNLLRAGLCVLPDDAEPLKVALVKWTVAFGVLLKLHLREDAKPDSIARELGAWLSPADVALLARARHKPNAALQVLSRLVRRAPPVERAPLEAALSAFSEALGRCERISRVPIPLSYTRHTSRFLIAWLALLPLGCWTSLRFEALLVAPLVAFLLFGVDQIGAGCPAYCHSVQTPERPRSPPQVWIWRTPLRCCRWMCWQTS